MFKKVDSLLNGTNDRYVIKRHPNRAVLSHVSLLGSHLVEVSGTRPWKNQCVGFPEFP